MMYAKSAKLAGVEERLNTFWNDVIVPRYKNIVQALTKKKLNANDIVMRFDGNDVSFLEFIQDFFVQYDNLIREATRQGGLSLAAYVAQTQVAREADRQKLLKLTDNQKYAEIHVALETMQISLSIQLN